jgi:ectoine hydroxylase-related dioxygenase (phytanoyl-CoA dioxygenase family)
MTNALSQDQIDAYNRDGYLVVENAVTADQLARLRAEMAGWVEESRGHAEPYGAPTIDGRPRFDMGTEHTADRPALRRVNNPSDISETCFEVMSDARTVDMVADLVGPDVKFHHCKINQKCPGANTTVYYHQDFAFTPHSNDDVVTALLMLDDVTLDNGCLMVVPGSHKGPMYSLFDGETFTGRVDDATEAALKAKQIPITGPAGSVCLMHTRLAHGSAPNASDKPRGLYICVYTAADAVPLARNPMPSPNEGRIVRGKPSLSARMIDFQVELPQQPKSASFFTVQGQDSAKTQAAE